MKEFSDIIHLDENAYKQLIFIIINHKIGKTFYDNNKYFNIFSSLSIESFFVIVIIYFLNFYFC